MSRIDTSHWHTKPKHEHTMIELWDVVFRLRDVERCHTSYRDLLKGDGSPDNRMYIEDSYIMDHMECVSLLNELSIALKLNNPYDLTLLDRLDAEIDKLESCRESMISYRHVRGQGYVK